MAFAAYGSSRSAAARDIRLVVDAIPALAWSSDADGSLAFVNQRWRDYTGLSSDALRGWGWKTAVHPDDLPLFDDWTASPDGGKQRECEVRLRRVDGVFRWFLLRIEPVRDEASDVVRWYGTGFDIQDAKQEELLRVAEKRTLELIADGASLSNVLNDLCLAIDEHTSASSLVFLMDEGGSQLLPIAGPHLPPAVTKAFTPWQVSPKGGACGTAAFTKQRVIIPDIAQDVRWPEDARGQAAKTAALSHGLRAAWSEPLISTTGEVIGTFCVTYSKSRTPSGRDLDFIAAAGHIARIAIERQRSQEKLREDERELRRITDAIPQTIVVLDPSGAPLYANQATLDFTGLTAKDVTDARFRERLFHPDDLERLRDARRSALARGLPFEAEQRALRKDGEYRWFLIRYNPLRNDLGQVIRWYATGTDIDERVRAEERTRNENLALRELIDRESMFEDIVGSSDAIASVLRQVAKVAPSDSTVLILGETGTGKELVARAIHKRSTRADRAFIGVSCAAIPQSLIASELFGHEKGSFTGATHRRLGRFESANGGTLFLDEIGDLPSEIQVALLRVLQEREIERVGGSKSISVDVRVIAATHRDLNALVAEGAFREDLLYRLNVVPLELPPLRKRATDIPLLVEYFIKRFGKRAGKQFSSIDKKSLKAFQAYGWPGNVRELQNVIERAVILSEGESGTFTADETWLKRKLPLTPKRPEALTGALLRQEKEMIEAALAESLGRVSGPSGAATRLGLPARTLDSKIKRLRINKYRFKNPQRELTREW
jgi:formate hydrogenlyase transcriptional activator